MDSDETTECVVSGDDLARGGFRAKEARQEIRAILSAIRTLHFEALVVVSGFLRVVTGEGSRDPTGPVNSSFEPSS